jgi:hypothetical protein
MAVQVKSILLNAIQYINGRPRYSPRLVQFGKYRRFLGNGLALIDFGSRVGNIHDSDKAGDNWYQEMFIESLSIAGSATVGIVAAKAGGAALACLAAATPAGWVLIIAGITFANSGKIR